MELPRKKLRNSNIDYSRSGAYFLTLCAHDRQCLFGNKPLIPKEWYKETGRFQYMKNTSENEENPHTVGATLCGCPRVPGMIEYWLHQIPKKFENMQLDYYVIMPNHIHVILILLDQTRGLPHRVAPTEDKVSSDIKPITISTVIDWFKTMTTNEYIRMVKCGDVQPFNKHVWDRSFYDRVIRSSDELYEIRKYIKNNPIKWMYAEN